MSFPTGSIQVTNNIGTTSSSDTYATHLASLGKGGFKSVATKADLDDITTARREFGMIVQVTSDSSSFNNITWQLCNIALGGNSNTLSDNANWLPYINANNGTTYSASGNFSITFGRNGILQLISFVPTVDMNLNIGTTNGGTDIYEQLSCTANVQQPLVLNYPFTSSTTIYVTGVSGGTILYNIWKLFASGY